MTERYQAAFIIPIGASKVLGKDGWEFKSSKRLPKRLEECLVEALNLEFVEAYSGVRRYAGDRVKMSIVFDGHNEIENIYFQFFYNSIMRISEVGKWMVLSLGQKYLFQAKDKVYNKRCFIWFLLRCL